MIAFDPCNFIEVCQVCGGKNHTVLAHMAPCKVCHLIPCVCKK